MLKKASLVMVVVLIGGVFVCTAVGAEKPTSITKSCSSEGCHDEYILKEFGHGPVLLGDCHSCHKPSNVENHEFEFERKGSDLCESCHLDQASKKVVHEPLKDKEVNSCITCHDPHASDVKGLLAKESTAATCADCHKVTEGKTHLHGPTAVGECSVCHNPHSSDHKGLLTIKPSELCVSCHIITKEELEKFEFIHEPATGDCQGCHDPHGADNWQMLRATAPEMCYACHEDIKKIAENSTHKHGAVTIEGGCLKCHTPHASTVKYILKAAPTDLCLTCHSKPIGVSKDEVLPSFTDQLQGKNPHGPVQDKDCSGCHKTHGSDHFRLLDKDYPAIFYAPYDEKNYALCFGCHENTLVKTSTTSDLTSFRNGDQNLHFLHVNKERRGRTCRACHETHTSNNPKHIRDKVPYGAWELPINFSKTETGGGCRPGCHAPKDYDRNTAVDYTPKAEPKPETAVSGN